MRLIRTLVKDMKIAKILNIYKKKERNLSLTK